MTTKKKINDDKEIKINDFVLKFLLVLLGTIIGILGNQLFFKGNKDYEMKMVLEKDLLKEQYQYLNRILLFTYNFELTNTIYHTRDAFIRIYLEQGTKKFVKRDTIMTDKVDTRSITLPSFVVDKDKRKQFLESIDIIKNNRDKIDFEVYSKFQELLQILIENPIPNTTNIIELENCIWNNKEVQDKWQKKTAELFYLTWDKLN
ncbi:MAG: hypothetical protein WCG82_00855 [Bacteroidota bacterium]